MWWEWIITVTVVIIIIFITLGIGWYVRNHNMSTPPPTPEPTISVWSSATPSNNPAKNTCQLYTFGTGELQGKVIPGTPSYDPLILDNLTGTTTLPTCIDSDQIIAQEVQHTCTPPPGATTARCYLNTGGVTGPGGTEIFYSNVGCPNISHCAGNLSLISLNYHGPTGPQEYCFQSNIMAPCDPTNTEQLFRVTRTNIGTNPNSPSNQSGPVTQFYHRASGLCLFPGTATGTSINSCGGPTVTGVMPMLGACRGATGYVWLLFPSINFCGNTGGCSQPQITPPQVVYVPNASAIPTDGYKGLTGSSSVFQWLIDNNANSLYYGGQGDVVLAPLGLDVTNCNNEGYIAQYLNLTTYNVIAAQPVCLATTTSTCTSL